MSKANILKFLIGLLFALAIALGLLGSRRDPYANEGLSVKSAASQKELWAYYRQGQQLAQNTQPQTRNLSAAFLAAGDIMLSRNVAGAIKKGGGDPNLPFSRMAEVLGQTDFNFANLESPLSGSSQFSLSGSLVFNAPPAYVKALAQYNFKILNLANNHVFDQGLKGLNFTGSFLDSLDIKHMGAGDNLTKAWQPVEIDSGGIKICFIGASYASVNDGGKTKNDYVARIEDIDNLNAAVNNARRMCDFVVVTMHAGTEYTRNPNAAQTTFARAAIDAGADMVIGAHPHWIQTIEKYRGKYIFYSLGNFIFDQMWSQDTREGLVLKISLSKNVNANPLTPNAATLNDLQGPKTPVHLDQVELLPIIIDNYSTPRPASAEETKTILQKIGQTETILK